LIHCSAVSLIKYLPTAASRCHVSRHLSGRLFFDQKMPAVTSGGTCSRYGTIARTSWHDDLAALVSVADSALVQRALDTIVSLLFANL
jgi:hypothetical protein